MPMPDRPKRQLRSLIWRTRIDEQVNAELDFHVEMLTSELVQGGMHRDIARAEALRRFGDINQVNATCRRIGTEGEREMLRTEYLGELRRDIGYAFRQLARSPGFTAVAILTLALGIGATTAIFSAVRSVVLRPFPFAHPDRVMMVAERFQDQDVNVSVGNYTDWKEQSKSFAALSAMQFSSLNLTEGDSPERVLAGRVTSNFFSVFGTQPALGRSFNPDEDVPGRENVVVLGHNLWVRRFGADAAVVGRVIRLAGREHTVLGVMPAGFNPTVTDEELWVPIAFTAEQKAEHDEHFLFLVGLLKEGVTREQAQAEMDPIMRRMAELFPLENGKKGVSVVPLSEALIGDFRERLTILLGAVVFVMLIACGNVANLLLARGAARSKEIAIRAAIGAGRGRIIRQLLTEGLVLSVLSAVAGVALAYGIIRALLANAPAGVPRLSETRIDLVVFAFALGVALVSGIIFSLAPALRAARQDLQGVLKEGGRGTTFARDRFRSALIVAQVALTLTLLAGAGLLIRSAMYLQTVRPGFDPSGILMARIALLESGYRDPLRVTQTFASIVEEMKRAPGVSSAAVVSQAPLGAGGGSNGLLPEGKPLDPANFINSRLLIITTDYFRTMRVPIKQGRQFTERDRAGAERVMIISEELARLAWPGENPIGKRVACCEGEENDPRWKTVIGVAGDVRSRGPTVDVVAEFYLPMEQVPGEAWDWVQRSMTLVARGPSDATSLTVPMRAAVRAVDPALPLFSITTMNDALRRSVAQSRFNTMLLGSLGVIGLLLAAAGIYSVIAYFVRLRRHEIGVRMALGATTRDVVTLVTWQGLRPVLIGILIGTATAMGATRLLRNSLYGVSATDPVTFAGVVVLLIVVGLVASLVPAKRASAISPTAAFRTS